MTSTRSALRLAARSLAQLRAPHVAAAQESPCLIPTPSLQVCPFHLVLLCRRILYSDRPCSLRHSSNLLLHLSLKHPSKLIRTHCPASAILSPLSDAPLPPPHCLLQDAALPSLRSSWPQCRWATQLNIVSPADPSALSTSLLCVSHCPCMLCSSSQCSHCSDVSSLLGFLFPVFSASSVPLLLLRSIATHQITTSTLRLSSPKPPLQRYC